MDLTPFTLEPSSKIALVLQGGPISVHTEVDFCFKGPDLSFFTLGMYLFFDLMIFSCPPLHFIHQTIRKKQNEVFLLAWAK